MRRNALISYAVFVLLLTGFAAGAAACQITCPDGSSCSIGFGTCQCFNDGHAYCIPGELDFASMTQPGSHNLSTPATAPEIGASPAFEGGSDLLIHTWASRSPAQR